MDRASQQQGDNRLQYIHDGVDQESGAPAIQMRCKEIVNKLLECSQIDMGTCVPMVDLVGIY